MNEHVETPQKGQPLRASWAAAVAARLNSPGISGTSGMLSRDGCGVGFDMLPANLRSRNHLRPFTVVGTSEDDYKFTIFVPDNVVSIGGSIVTPTGITAVPDTDGWYTLDDESDVDENGSTLYLIAYDDESAEFSFDIDGGAAGGGSSSSEKSVVAVLPIAELKTQELGEKTYGIVTRQLACHPFAIGSVSGSGDDPDEDDGYEGSLTLLTRIEYETVSSEKVINAYGRNLTFTNGRVTAVGNEGVISSIPTTPHSAEMDAGYGH